MSSGGLSQETVENVAHGRPAHLASQHSQLVLKGEMFWADVLSTEEPQAAKASILRAHHFKAGPLATREGLFSYHLQFTSHSFNECEPSLGAAYVARWNHLPLDSC